MSKRLDEDWDTSTDCREIYLYMFQKVQNQAQHNAGILKELFLDVGEYGAEANGESEQGPPRSCDDFEGA